MKRTFKRFSLTILTGTALLAQTSAAEYEKLVLHVKDDSGRPQIICQPRSQIVKAGTSVKFTVEAANTPAFQRDHLSYRWSFNGKEIDATTNHLVIENADLSSVGEYRVTVTRHLVEKTYTIEKTSKELMQRESEPAYLSVYTLWKSNSNGGALSAPIGQFSSGTFSCGVGTFDRYNCFFPFDGPNASPASIPYPNTDHSPRLTLDTFTNINNQIDTGIVIQEDFGWLNIVCCNDNATGGTYSKQSRCYRIVMATSTDAKYRVGIFYKSSTLGGNTTVTFRWRYD